MALKDDSAPFAEAFGAALRGEREKLGWSQEDLGFEAELDRTYISGIERGVRNPTLKTMQTLCRALGVVPSTLLHLAERQIRWHQDG